jgi:hypothetical protein
MQYSLFPKYSIRAETKSTVTPVLSDKLLLIGLRYGYGEIR